METWDDIRMPLKEDRLWELYHENSKTPRYIAGSTSRDADKEIAELHRSLPVNSIMDINLQPPNVQRNNSGLQEVTSDILSGILVNSWHTIDSGYRTAYLSPLEIFIIVSHLEGLTPGLYHLDKDGGVLRLVDKAVTGARLRKCLHDPGVSNVHLCITALFRRSTMQLGEQGYRFAVAESGRMLQAVLHESTTREIRASIIHGYYERAVEDLLGIDGVEHAVLQMIKLQ